MDRILKSLSLAICALLLSGCEPAPERIGPEPAAEQHAGGPSAADRKDHEHAGPNPV